MECPRSYEDVDVLELLDGIRVDKLPGWANEGQRDDPARFGSFSLLFRRATGRPG